MGHPSALHRPEYSHISYLIHPFCHALACSKRCGKKTHSTKGYLMLNVHPSSLMRKMLPGVNVIVAAYCHGSNERNCAYSNNSRPLNSTPKRTLIANTYIKTYEHVMLSDVASSLSQRPSRNATKQLRPLEQRATPQLQETHSHPQHTRSVCYQVPITIVTVYHRIARRINCALSNDKRHAATSALL